MALHDDTLQKFSISLEDTYMVIKLFNFLTKSACQTLPSELLISGDVTNFTDAKDCAQGKKLATPYARAVMKMLPQTHPDEGEGAPPHEPINDIHVHNLTLQQLFVPVSESRTFTRRDAARAFHETLSSVDVRSPQANLIVAERAVLAGKTAAEAKKEFEALNVKEEDEYARKIGEEQALLEKRTIRHRTDRCEFRFQTYNANDVGKTGRKADAVGWRYGAPLQDRKRGAVKIPTSVP